MEVTEGRASRGARTTAVVTATMVPAAAATVFALWPPAVTPFLWVGLAVGAGVTGRNLLHSVLARFVVPQEHHCPARCPAVVLVIPCLNELPCLARTVPAMAELQYDGELVLCYVCEAASDDGSRQFLRQCAAEYPRVKLVEKPTPPGGRGAAVAFGLKRAPEAEVVGFVDADHVLEQASLEALASIFAGPQPPAAVQGVVATANPSPGPLALVLSVEREWLEKVELQISKRLGGICHFGGGQGFFLRHVVDDPELSIDEAMILDDTDLSFRFALRGLEVLFDSQVVTRATQPETVGEFIDQRLRWARGWLQIARKHFWGFIRGRELALRERLDLLRLVLTPLVVPAAYLAFAAAAVALLSSSVQAPLWLSLPALLWPFLLGPQPYVAGSRSAGLLDVPLILVGIPLLFYAYAALLTASLVQAAVLRHRPRYAKTTKPG